MTAYYNEHDPFAAAWLRELIKDKLIADGEVDERSIAVVRPDDLRGFSQCHFFAGIGGWSHALRLAGWPDDQSVWTGSCPCQPFSAAGQGNSTDDPRDLWPVWFRLIRECRPDVVFGEQVEAAIAHGWLDRICDDLEAEGYAVGAVGLPAASVGAPHLRQRLWFVAESRYGSGGSGIAGIDCTSKSARQDNDSALISGGELGDSSGARLAQQRSERRTSRGQVATNTRETSQRTGASAGAASGLADTDGRDTEHGGLQRGGQHGLRAEGGRADGQPRDGERPEDGRLADADRDREVGHPGEESGERITRLVEPERGGELRESFWSACDWISCRDGKARPVEPGTQPLAYGVPARVGRLRGYGNAIVTSLAAEFIAAYLES